MSYQQCPICFGSGIVNQLDTTNIVCPTCSGAKIIDSLTGLPPIPNEPSLVVSIYIVNTGKTQQTIIHQSDKTK